MNAQQLETGASAQWITESELLSRDYTSFGIGFHFGRPESVEWDAAGWPVNRWSRARVERYEAEMASGRHDNWRTGIRVG